MRTYGMGFLEVKKMKEKDRRLLLKIIEARTRKQKVIELEIQMRKHNGHRGR